jgi:hypothetical protein
VSLCTWLIQATTQNQNSICHSLLHEFGSDAADAKLTDSLDIGPRPFSILAFHNRFAAQIRNAFVIGGYYPALTGAGALGERILNHLLRTLREDFSHTSEYRKVARKDSFDRWEYAINTLVAWSALLPEAAEAFRELSLVRNRTIHFHPATDDKDRSLALETISLLDRIINAQCNHGSSAMIHSRHSRGKLHSASVGKPTVHSKDLPPELRARRSR